MRPRRSFAVASILYPTFTAGGEVPPQRYDYSFQLYQEDDDRIRVEAHYLRGEIDFNDANVSNPPRPGIISSSKTRSNRAFDTSSTASSPLVAVAT